MFKERLSSTNFAKFLVSFLNFFFTELEKFVQANTQELAKDKWLCPLSGKKFRGPEFVRKHIFNKHGDKVDEVKTEVRLYVEKKYLFNSF